AWWGRAGLRGPCRGSPGRAAHGPRPASPARPDARLGDGPGSPAETAPAGRTSGTLTRPGVRPAGARHSWRLDQASGLIRFGSTGMPGPIVVDSVTLRM